MLSGHSKVEDWLLWRQRLQQRQEFHGDTDEHEALKLLETRDLTHIRGTVYANQFVASDAGAITIASYGKPSLSVIYPDVSKSPRVLSNEKDNGSLIWMKIYDKEFIAVVWKDSSIRLWDVEKATSEVVYKMDSNEHKHTSLCSIDDRTVAYGGAYPSEDDINNIHILNTDTKPWSLGNVLMVEGVKVILDMCHLVADDDTHCLLLCCPYEHRVQAVELIGGRVRWRTDKQQMGEETLPWSICTNQVSGVVYVADNHLHKLHLLASEDGSVLTSVNLLRYDIVSPSCVSFSDGDVFVGHVDKNWKISQISRFVKSENQDSTDPAKSVKSIHTQLKQKRKRKFYLMLYLFTCSLIFLAFANAFAWCE